MAVHDDAIFNPGIAKTGEVVVASTHFSARNCHAVSSCFSPIRTQMILSLSIYIPVIPHSLPVEEYFLYIEEELELLIMNNVEFSFRQRVFVQMLCQRRCQCEGA
ncbi:hypothetical protein TNCT_494011 [Trichonephila clavata]|uniref:Uncharacterized protein n=1 Tax=Trichonephila clavata TaxID=2740835 RepID=A0A8X6LHI7_TRICU|nr:hypothetical protein TNCT_494011 [Trichonephila clavata]